MLFLYLGFIECPYQLLRSYKRYDEKKSKMIVFLHAAGRLPISSAHSMDARKCVHAQKPYSCLAYEHESSKVGGGGKKGRQTGQTDARRLMERKAAQQNKTLPENTKTKPT